MSLRTAQVVPPRVAIALAAAAASASIAAAFAAFAPPAHAAAADWSLPPTVVSPDAYYAQYSQDAAANAHGDAVVVWATVDQKLGYTRRTAGGPFQTPVIEQRYAGSPTHASINASGTAVILWREGDSAHGIVLPPGGAAPEPFDLRGRDPACTADPDGGIDDAGNVTVFWTDCDDLWTATRPAGSNSFGAPHKIDTKGLSPSIMHAAVGADGTRAVLWKDYDGINAAVAPQGGAFTTTVLTSDTDTRALRYDPHTGLPEMPLVAVGARGDVVVATTESVDNGADYVEVAAMKPAGAAWHKPVVLGSGPSTFRTPVTVDPSGTATVLWFGNHASGAGGLLASSTRDGSFSAPPVVVESDLPACGTDIASDDAGSLYAVWNGYDQGCQGSEGYEGAAIKRAGTTQFGPVTELDYGTAASPYGGAALEPPVVAGEGTGALAVWPQGNYAPDYLLRIKVSDSIGSPKPPPGGAGGDPGGRTPSGSDPSGGTPSGGTPSGGTGSGGTPSGGTPSGGTGSGGTPTGGDPSGGDPGTAGPTATPDAGSDQSPSGSGSAPDTSESGPEQNATGTAPPTTLPPRVRAARFARVKHGRVRVKLVCDGSKPCLTRVALFEAHKRIAMRGPYEVAAGHTRVVRVRVGRRAAAGHRRVRVKLVP